MIITRRAMWKMILLMIITGGLYMIYWLFVTKNQLNQAGEDIPTAWLFFVPIANFYFLYRLTQSFCRRILQNESATLMYFILLVFLLPAGEIVFQSHMNEHTSSL